jgi:D-alanyl-D-alanine carboxypeptidase
VAAISTASCLSSGVTSRLLTLLLLAVAVSGCGGGDSGSAPPPPVDRIAQELALSGPESVIVHVADGDREYTATAGTRQPRAEGRFRIGSVTKTFTAAIVLQLVAEGRLRLDDTLADHLPGLAPERTITIRQLLTHRSGLANVTDYPAWLERASRSASTRPEDSLRFAAAKPPVFAAGTRWGYSNTNYIALGLVIEKVTGRSYGEELQERLFEPLELESTELPRTRRVRDLNDPGENPQVPWAAGAIVSNAADLARFFSALLSGRVLEDDSLAEMKRIAPIDRRTGVGLGIYSSELPCGRFWGHDGGILDYATLVQASDDGERVAVVSLHGDAFSGPRPETGALLCR